MYSVASEDDIVFINETYNENIDRLHGVQRNVDVWKELMSCKDSTYYVVNAETPVAWFRIDMEDGGLWIGMLQVKPMYQHLHLPTTLTSSYRLLLHLLHKAV